MAKPLSVDHDFCLQKLRAAISIVSVLEEGDYPHSDSLLAIQKIKKVYEQDLFQLESISAAAADTLLEFCRRSNTNICRLKPFLGLILRSSNLRNSFETYFPIKLLANSLLGGNPRLVLSSEWAFSPFIYPVALRELPDFVFIGMPASECQNPLVIPLAAHELGHVVWNRNGAKKEFDPSIKTQILAYFKEHWNSFQRTFQSQLPVSSLETDMFVRSAWTRAFTLAQRQVEEMFCDFVALSVFGRSFLLAFRYLLAPSLGQYRSPLYPRIRDRATFLADKAKISDISCDGDFKNCFSDQEPVISLTEKFIQTAADEATRSLISGLGPLVEKYKGNTNAYQEGNADELTAETSMRDLVPPLRARSVEPLINACWNIRLSLDDWKIMENIRNETVRRDEKIRVLKDLTLKACEVFEFNRRTNTYAD